LLLLTAWMWCTFGLCWTDSEFCFYVKVLKCLRVAIQYKKSYKWRNLRPLYYDSVPCDTCLTVQHFLVKTKFQPCLTHCILLISWQVISEMTQVWAHEVSPPLHVHRRNSTESNSVSRSHSERGHQRCFQQWKDP